MSAKKNTLELTAVGLTGIDVSVHYLDSQSREKTFRPDWIRLQPEGFYIPGFEPLAGAVSVEVEWKDCPFTPGTLRSLCKVAGRYSGGSELRFEDVPPPSLFRWFSDSAALLGRRPPDSALRTSKLYTLATVISATGLFCGAVAISLPLLLSDQAWVDLFSKILLAAMVASIAGFAWLRALAGRAELKAIAQSRS